MCYKTSLLFLSMFLLITPLWAGNGHLLHGVGPVNSSMGGAGTGLPIDVVGALHANPALLIQFDGTHVGIGSELFADDLKMGTTDPDGIGVIPTASHTVDSDGEPGVLPALGWTYHNPSSKVAYGGGLLAVAGFRTNWPSDKRSLLLQPQPKGFGKLNTELQVTKVPLAIAWQVNPKLSLGASLNLYSSRLIINPLPVVVPDCADDDGNILEPPIDPQGPQCFRPGTGVPVTEFAVSVQLGLYYELNSKWSLGFAYTSEQDTAPYQWNSEHVHPAITSGPQTFHNPRRIEIDLDQPPIASFGLGYRHSPGLRIAFDVRWVGYADTKGIGGPGGIADDQRLISIGWRDIYIGMLGVEWEPGGGGGPVTWRFGININQSPITTAKTINSGGTPSVFEEHYTVGASIALTPTVKLDLGAYYTPENSITGPFIGAEPATVTLTNSIRSVLIGLSFDF